MDLERTIIERRLPPPNVRRALREASGLSVVEVAEAIGVTRQAVWRWERGLREPGAHHRRAYAGFLDQVRQAVGS